MLSFDTYMSTYKIVGYSANLCADDDIVLNQTISSRPLEINGRRPICSFKLGKRPFKSINVVFSYSGIDTVHSMRINDTKCYDLCNTDSGEYRYPKSVKILEEDGSKANNFIKVSELSCDQEQFGGQGIQFMEIHNRNGKHLARLRLKEPNRVIRAFQIIPMSQNM